MFYGAALYFGGLSALSFIVRSNADVSATINVFAGTGSFGNSGYDGPAVSAQIDEPYGVWGDSVGNVYIADVLRVRRVDSSGIIHAVFGTGYYTVVPDQPYYGIIGGTDYPYGGDNGAATSAYGTAYYLCGNTVGTIYIADSYNRAYRSIDSSGIIRALTGRGTTYITNDGIQATAAHLMDANACQVDTAGNIYTTEETNVKVRKVDASTKLLSTAIGTGSMASSDVSAFNGNYGPATSAKLYYPLGLYLDSTVQLYVANSGGTSIRRADLVGGLIYPYAGTGTSGTTGNGGKATAAKMASSLQIFGDVNGNMFLVQSNLHNMRWIDGSTDIIDMFAGSSSGTSGKTGNGGAATSALMNNPSTVFASSTGIVYVADFSNYYVRSIAYQVMDPSASPTTIMPSGAPSISPTFPATTAPSCLPTVEPSLKPSAYPSIAPSQCPSEVPSLKPSSLPTTEPSLKPSAYPSIAPSQCPSKVPSLKPSSLPTTEPSLKPSVYPTIAPSALPTVVPSLKPSSLPTTEPSLKPSVHPTAAPTLLPTVVPSLKPSCEPTQEPSLCPSCVPSLIPSVVPSVVPSVCPSESPSVLPSIGPSLSPSVVPTLSPSESPTVPPSLAPTALPTIGPTQRPSCIPTIAPSPLPSVEPTLAPSCVPTIEPTLQPSVLPSIGPSAEPTAPTIVPSLCPSCLPSLRPSAFPSAPTFKPSNRPSVKPSRAGVTTAPTFLPSRSPTAVPTQGSVIISFNSSLSLHNVSASVLDGSSVSAVVGAVGSSVGVSSGNVTLVSQSSGNGSGGVRRRLTGGGIAVYVIDVVVNVRASSDAYSNDTVNRGAEYLYELLTGKLYAAVMSSELSERVREYSIVFNASATRYVGVVNVTDVSEYSVVSHESVLVSTDDDDDGDGGSSEKHGGLSAGGIAGVVIGGIVLLLLLIYGACHFCRKSQRVSVSREPHPV